MSELLFPPVKEDSLEQPQELFYSRLNKGEPERVKETLETLKEYMTEKVENSFLIAGVGGILRFLDPRLAQDIDLAVVGLKYTIEPHSYGSHSFQDVIEFTDKIQDYFEGLNRKLISELGLDNREISFDRDGSGPFAHFDRKYSIGAAKKPSTTLESDLESFGWWDSKGLRVCFDGIRPIDVQFIFNQSPEEWRTNQETLEEIPTETRRDISKRFPYAILS